MRVKSRLPDVPSKEGLLAEELKRFFCKNNEYYGKRTGKRVYDYFTQLNDAEKKSVVQMLKAFLQSRKENPDRISIEQYNKEIEEAMIEVKKGEVYTHEEVEKMSRSW